MGQGRIPRCLAQPEVCKVREVTGVEQDVLRLDIPVHEFGFMGGVERVRDVAEDPHAATVVERACNGERLERGPMH